MYLIMSKLAIVYFSVIRSIGTRTKAWTVEKDEQSYKNFARRANFQEKKIIMIVANKSKMKKKYDNKCYLGEKI